MFIMNACAQTAGIPALQETTLCSVQLYSVNWTYTVHCTMYSVHWHWHCTTVNNWTSEHKTKINRGFKDREGSV